MALRVATYNVQNLFAPSDNGVAKPMVALKAVARVLDLMAADVVALQEVASHQALARLNDLLRAPYPYLYSHPGNSERGIHLAFLSRVPLGVHSHRELPLKAADGSCLPGTSESSPLQLQRDLLRADVEPIEGHGSLTLFNVHLKSKHEAPDQLHSSDAIRAAEARAIATEVVSYEQAHPNRPVVLLGDLNDQLESAALEAFAGMSWSDSLAMDYAQQCKKGRLPGTYWSKRRLRIDYILLSAQARASMVPGSAQVHASSLAQRGSDHYPVSTDLRL